MKRGYDKRELQVAASSLQFSRDPYEKVLRLIDILRFVFSDPFLKDRLLLKGGTAINLTVFSLPRLSIDIDFDYAINESLEEVNKARERISDILKRHLEGEGYILSAKSRFSHNLDSFRFAYMSAGGGNDAIKIDINYSMRAHVLAPERRKVTPSLGELEVPTLALTELFAAKGKAMLERAAARDLYDWNHAIDDGLLDEDRELLRKCIVFYAGLASETKVVDLSGKAIDSISLNQIKRDLLPILKGPSHFDLEREKEKAKGYIEELMNLTDGEKDYLRHLSNKEYRPDLLFDDPLILERIKYHPVIIWKCRK